ncbi:Sugar (and other) transporter [Geosmithia morbida]|uniref:Sugar (And other) transporter n=1 Tax=Geosmithia morbida TaxID=1094350 RepID=A0A9P4Z335_9HYPO|nr:Sugar (and other) transporter [Geosmithia morbida]KAF4126626.1 Sugar (and other) transporter [Geosmithia morbida]
MAELKETGPPPELSDDSGTVEAGAPINERSLLRKLDLKLLPAVGVLYLLSFLDRSNVGNARIEGMVDDLNMTGNQYLTGLTLYFVGYVIFEGIGKMAGVVWDNGWRWIFILEGIATVVIAFGAFWFIQNYPETSGFLNPAERRFIHDRLTADSDAMRQEKFTWAAVGEALRDPSCWLYGLGFHTMSLPLYTLSLFMPTIIKDLGYQAAVAQLLTIPPYAVSFVTTLTVAVFSERTGQRAVFIAGSSVVGAIGYVILLANTDPTARPGVSYLGTFFAAAGIYPATALVLSWPAINVSGQTKRAIANAMQISIGNLGAVMGTQLYRSDDGPRFVVGHSLALAYLVANAAVVTVLAWRLRRQNKEREAVSEEIKHVGEVEDWKGDSDPRWRFEY